MATTTLIQVEAWIGNQDDLEAQRAGWEVGRDEGGPGRIAIHTMIDGTGSHASFYLDRESAIELAGDLLTAIRLDA